MANQSHSREGFRWTVRQMRWARSARLAILGLGLALGLSFSAVGLEDVTDEPFILGACFFLVASLLSFTPGFVRFQPWVLTLIAILDLAAINMFDLIPRAEVVDALVALPAMCLGLTLGRRGVAVAVLAVAVLDGAPGVLSGGQPLEGWVPVISVTVLAGLAAAGMAVSTQVWSRQIRSLEQQGQALQSAVTAKGDFIALVSHELRTPLTSIIGYLDMLDDVEEPIPEEALHYLAAVSRNSDRLLLLVTDLLAASEVENTPMRLDLAPTDVAALATHSLDDMMGRAGEAGLSLIRDLPPGITIEADASRIGQVIDNLLSNALKFTPAGGQVAVTLLRSGDGIDLMVRDTGIGIESAALPHLTSKFFRTRQATESAIPGVGLGLMITRTVVEAHHGTLTFTSREHHWTSVTVHLPTTQPSPDVTTQSLGGRPTTVRPLGFRTVTQ